MGSAERVALIEEVTFVRDVRRGQRQRVHLHGRAGADVERRVRPQMRGTIALQKSRTVIDVRSDPGRARKREPDAGRQGVTLIMIEQKSAGSGGLKSVRPPEKRVRSQSAAERQPRCNVKRISAKRAARLP